MLHRVEEVLVTVYKGRQQPQISQIEDSRTASITVTRRRPADDDPIVDAKVEPIFR